LHDFLHGTKADIQAWRVGTVREGEWHVPDNHSVLQKWMPPAVCGLGVARHSGSQAREAAHSVEVGYVKEMARQFMVGEPFPNVTVDGFLPEETANKILDAYPDMRSTGRRLSHKNVKNKFATTGVPIGLRWVFDLFSSEDMVRVLSEIAGEELFADPSYFGAGFHEITHGGFLRIHADFNIHPETQRLRCLNLLYFLNKDWEDSWDGNLELWDESRCVKSICPDFNRAVIFQTSSTSFHGHPRPLSCPQGRSRRSLAFYYYGSKAKKGLRHHSTLYREDLI
jgi:hypothetical protein